MSTQDTTLQELVDAEMAAYSNGEYAKHSDTRDRLFDFARAAIAAQAPQPTRVWSVESKTFEALYATKADAEKYVASLPITVSGGMSVSAVPVIGAQQTQGVPIEPIATFQGRRLTPDGTSEFWGWLRIDPSNDPPVGALLYTAQPPSTSPCQFAIDGGGNLYRRYYKPVCDACVPAAKETDKWESARVADFNAGWNACRESVLAAAPQAEPQPEREPLTWLQFCEIAKAEYKEAHGHDELLSAPDHEREETLRFVQMIERAMAESWGIKLAGIGTKGGDAK